MSVAEREARARRLLAGVEKNHSPAVFACDFGAADMVVLDLIARDGLAIAVVALDTASLPRPAQALIARVRRDYGIEVRVYEPWPESVDAYLAQYGGAARGDAQAVEARAAIRRREPLRRALAKKRGWISAERGDVAEVGLDPAHGLWKFAPLAEWSDDEVQAYLSGNRVPCATPPPALEEA